MRFRADDGSDFPEWISRSLSDYVKRVTRKNNDQSDIPLTISSLDGLVDQRSYFHKTVASKDLSNYLLLKRGEFAYNKSYSVGFPFGSIKRLENFDQGALSTLYICFALTDEKLVNSEFLKHYWDSQRWVPEVSTICAEGARNHGLLNVSTSDFFEISTILPISLLEQKKIAAFLSSVDSTIALCQKKLDLLIQAKKALMQQIFSQKLRFKADDGSDFPEWEKKRLDKTGTFYGGLSGKSSPDFTNGNAQFLTYMNVYKNAFARQDLTSSVKISEKESPNHVEYGDILFTQSSETVEEVGLSSVYLFKDRPYLNSFCMGFRPNSLSELDPRYMGYCMRSEPVRRQIIVEGQGISRINIAASRLGTIKFLLPSLPEQQKIAACLSSADALIDQARAELEQWQEVKKSLLQQLFV